MKVASLTDIHNVVSRLLYSSPAMELDFYPTFEVQKSTWDNIQEEVKIISQRFAAWRRLPSGCSIFAQNFLAAFAKPLLPAGRFISRKLNLEK